MTYRNLNIKYFVSILLVISAGFLLIIAGIMGIDLRQATSLFSALPKVLAGDLFCIAVFIKWLWKWKLFYSWLVPFPNLNGTWEGTIQSDWTNPKTGEKTPPIPAMIGIKQSLVKISCVVRTVEMRSDSFIEGFKIDSDRQLKQLIYTYSSRPRTKMSDRSFQHDGSVVLDIIESPIRKLVGRYWTERKTTGEMHFEFREKKFRDELPKELQKHPLQS